MSWRCRFQWPFSENGCGIAFWGSVPNKTLPHSIDLLGQWQLHAISMSYENPYSQGSQGYDNPLVLFTTTRDPWFFFTVQEGLNSSIFVWIAGGPPAQLGPILGAMLGYVDNAWRPARAPSVLGMDLWDVDRMWQDSSRWGIWVNFRGPSNPWKFKNMNTPSQRNFG